jgi:bis(5'-nucleosidyl)-tetraphosphatase
MMPLSLTVCEGWKAVNGPRKSEVVKIASIPNLVWVEDRREKMPREKSCGAVVYTSNGEIQYLLLKYGAGHWDFVKGQMEAHESEKTTAVRELQEETGISDARFVDGFREKIHYFYRRGRKTIYKEVAYFLVEALSDKVELSYEHVGYAWLKYENALERLTFRNARNVMKKAHRFLEIRGNRT